MALQLSERERQIFASVGYQYAVKQSHQPFTPEKIARLVLRVLKEPEARAVEAAVLALLELARKDALDKLNPSHPDVSRRLGYIVERLSQHDLVPSDLQRNLAHLATNLSEFQASEMSEPLFLTDKTTPGRARRLVHQSDETSRKWYVFGHICLRDDAPL